MRYMTLFSQAKLPTLGYDSLRRLSLLERGFLFGFVLLLWSLHTVSGVASWQLINVALCVWGRSRVSALRWIMKLLEAVLLQLKRRNQVHEEKP